jgi:hypothetical protein
MEEVYLKYLDGYSVAWRPRLQALESIHKHAVRLNNEQSSDPITPDKPLIVAFNKIDGLRGGVPYIIIPNGWPTEPDKINAFLNQQVEKNLDMVHGVRNYDELVYFNTPGGGRGILFSWIIRTHDYIRYPELQQSAPIMQLDQIPEETPYVYPVAIMGSDFFEQQYWLDGGTFPERVLQDTRAGLCKILFHETFEGHGFNLDKTKIFLEAIAEKNNVPTESLGFLDCNWYTPSLQQSYNTKGFCYQYFEKHVADGVFTGHTTPEFVTQNVENLRNGIVKDKPYTLINLNRRIRQQRVYTVLGFHYLPEEAKKNIMWTFLEPSSEQFVDYVNRVKAEPILPEGFADQFPVEYDVDASVNDTKINSIQTLAHIQLIGETMFFNPHTSFFSEKIYKPLISGEPFILIGCPGSLKVLKDMGYKTFSPWINESYDDILDPAQRLKAIMLEVERLALMPKEEIHQMMLEMQENALHNYKTYYKRVENFTEMKKTLGELRDWVYNR